MTFLWKTRNMYHITSMFFFLHHLILTTASSYYPVDDIAVNCGSSGNSIAFDGREWTADIRSHGKSMSSKVLQSLSVDPIPYTSARISRSEFAYTFQVSPGQKFIRLHFYPASYSGFKKSRAVFTVKAGAYTLLSNFSASLTADVLGLKSFAKEFCVNVEETEALKIIFSPSPSTSNDIYAFVNGIEIISMPTGLYYTPHGDPGAHVVGQKYRFHIDNNTALELVHRLNSGGSSISSVEDWGMFRRWSEDSNYLLELGVLPVTTSIPIKYTNIPMYTAPQRVYQTAWLMDPNKQACNLTWKLPVDLGFRYLVRLHFCELDYGIKEVGEREFSIFIINKTAEARADLIKWSGGNGVALYRDYVVMMAGNRMEGKSDLLIALQACYNESKSKYHTGAILNGIEVFKLSNPDNNLAGQNPNSLAHSPALTTPKLQKLIIAFGNKNVIVSGLIILLSSLNVIVYQLRCWAERANQKDRSESSKPKESCRCFSLSEIQLATNNFDDALIIGIGGFGKVYKGLIDKGATTVAVKRLKSMSKQGAEEFWTEIKMLSYLRHTHLVTLIGYCNDGNEMILVYEYMVNGTLADHLHKMSRNGNGKISPLCWEQRLSICLGAARGLEYLHTGAQHRVIHRDVKTSNILLDENWVAKISDFGLSKMGGNTTNQSSTSTYVITEVKGTFGYLDVEYFLTHRLTRKSDVYAFGVVLFEVLCGRPAVDKRFEGEERSLALWAQRCIKEGKHDQMIDSSIKGQISPQCQKVLLEVANKCLHNRPSERPRMSDVVQRLEFALASQDQNAYSSTDTEVEQEEAINVSMAVNMSIDTITEGEEEKGKGNDEEVVDVDVADIKKVDVIKQSTVSQQPMDSPVLIPDSTSSMPKEKANKKSLTKFVQSIVRWRKTKANNSSDGSSLSGGMPTAKEKPSQALPESSCSSPPLPALPGRSFSLAEIHEATNNFHRNLVIKYGGPGGEMYRGYIDNGELQVAIERRITESENKFLEEVVMRSRIHHLHLVSFIGYCKDSGETIIVYEYMVKGSLRDQLYGTGNDPLPWKKRLEICIEAAQGLHYLHTCSQGRIIHGDLKSSSILLDEKWVAKVSGLEASKLELDGNNMTGTLFTHVIMKTHAYKDPEYLMSGHLTTKSDAYSFGVILLEVLCAVEPYSPHLARGQTYLTHRFKRCIQKKTIEQIIDPYLIGKIVPKSLRAYVKVAECCLGFRGDERPSMNTVVQSLQQALQLQETDESSYKFIKPGDPPEKIHEAAVRAYNKVL